MKKQLHIYYSGKVQGIGFRYAVQDIANQQNVCGWVRNLSDGRVEILVEAEEGVLSDFLAQVNQHFSQHIKEVHVEWQPAYRQAGRQSGEFRDFQVLF